MMEENPIQRPALQILLEPILAPEPPLPPLIESEKPRLTDSGARSQGGFWQAALFGPRSAVILRHRLTRLET